MAANGTHPQGLETSLSNSWDLIGIYDLVLTKDLAQENETGLYGMTTVSQARNLSVKRQTVAGIATSDFWLGHLGLAHGVMMYHLLNGPAASTNGLLLNLIDRIPSMSFGYTAGASYGKMCTHRDLRVSADSSTGVFSWQLDIWRVRSSTTR